jgi:DNA-binding MarR family transcriptional regulator
MTTPTDDQLAKLGAAFDTFARRYKLADALGSETQLNELDKQALLFVADHPGCGPTDIARFLAVPNTTISSSTDRLVKRGLLERHRPEGDRRAVALRLSAEGKARADAIATVHRELYRRMLEPLSPAERKSFIRLITKIVFTRVE